MYLNQKSISWIGHMALKLSKSKQLTRTIGFTLLTHFCVYYNKYMRLYKYYKYLIWSLDPLYNTRSFHFHSYTKCLPCCPFKPSYFTEGKGLWHTFIYPFYMASCDEAAHLSTHEDDIHKVFCDHWSNQRKSSIIYKQLSNEGPHLNTQNPQWNNQGILSETLLTVIDPFVQI